ncbi:MAG: peroxiredoxin [Alphaproteobacteria bacterium]
MAKELSVGDKAPAFTLPTDGDGKFALRKAEGPVVLYFYPKDDTPGCTTEGIEFTAALPAFEKCGVTVVGASKDTVAKHDKFKAKHGLGITLISDEEGSLCEKYGVWVEKKNYGRTYMGIERSTFLIDSKGKIVQIWRKVRVKGHVEKVLEAAQTL